MKICMFTNTYLPHVGGVARSVSTFAADLRAMGHEVLVVAPTFDAQSDNPEDEKHVLRVPAIQHFNGSDFSVRIPLPNLIEDRIDRFEPDIIHSHHPFLLGDAALRTARHHDLPLIFTHHTLYEEYTHYVPLDSKPLRRFVINLSTEYANLCNHVIAPSNSIRCLLQKRGVRSPVVVLPTGVDLERLGKGNGKAFRERWGIPSGVKVIGHVGRLAGEKNLPYLASAVASFLRQDRQAYCVVAGTGDAESEIRKIFSGSDLSQRLIMPGILKSGELADCYHALDIFVFASKSETQGLVLMEAMAAGVPVIALRASGVSDVVKDQHNGRILRANAAKESFAEAIRDAFSNGKLQGWRREALQTAAGFSRRNCAARLLELYQGMAGKVKRRHGEVELLDTIYKNIKVEWELVQEKMSALMEALAENETSRAVNRRSGCN